jgi:hypothetical protein
MKCPHCQTAIREEFASTALVNTGDVTDRTGKAIATAIQWTSSFQRCPECHQSIIYLRRADVMPSPGNPSAPRIVIPREEFMAYPKSPSRPIPQEVITPYRDDFSEACKVLADSPKASAALSRRCLQAILRDKASTTSNDLYDQIEEVITAGKLPTHITDGLHAVRNIGNIAAHSMKSKTTGAILDVEPGEAEWNLDVLESLFDFYFVAPAAHEKRKAALNPKLKDAGKPQLP